VTRFFCWGMFVGAISALGVEASEIDCDYVLRGGLVVDGTGAPGQKRDVAIRGDRIVAIGKMEVGSRAKVIDVSGRIVAPGFIDLHSHSDRSIVEAKTRGNINFLTQGVTTVVTGNCGSSPTDAGKFFETVEQHGAGTNVILLIGQGSLRRSVMGNGDRKPTSQELERMKGLVDREMRAGAWGISSGLIYVPSRYASTAELVELSNVVARHGGIYATHMRDEGKGLIPSIEESLTIGREANIPLHISHLKVTGKKNWGTVGAACDRIRQARDSGQVVSADQYPYVASATTLSAMVVPDWARQGTAEDFARIAADPQRGPRLRREIAAELEDRDGGASIRISSYRVKPSRVGKDLATIAREEGLDPISLVIDIESQGDAGAISFGMSEEDVRFVLSQDFVATASDASAHLPGEDRPHPRAYGTFPRKFRYALDEKLTSLEQAVHSCTGLPAKILRMPDRGVLRAGAFADVVVFDQGLFRDSATFDEPTRYAKGVDYLFVNGVAAIAGGKLQNKLAGRALRLTKDGPADLIVKAARLWTGDTANPWAEAVASRGGEIVAVGKAEEVERFKGPNTKVIDRPQGFAIPGLIDAHGHLTELGAEREQIELRGVSSLDEVARRVKAKIDASPGDGWILGRSFDQSLYPGGEFPTKDVLDKVAPDRPVWLIRVDGHAGWANSEALRRAKITRNTKAPSDGQILRDKDGNPTGILIDGAASLVWGVVPASTKEEIARRIMKGQALCFESGLTGVHDASVSAAESEVYRQLDREGKLKLRVYGMASPPGNGEVAFASTPPIPMKPGRRFEMRAIKLFIDGAMGSRGGLLFDSYSDDPGNSGLMLIEPKVLEATTIAALKHGWQVCTHAIGDKGNALVLDAYEAALKSVPEAKDARLRIEHAQVVRKEDVGRFARSGIIASMQPSHSSDDMRWADARLGPARVQGAYAWRWFLDAKVPLAFGSDFPVEIVNPFWGIYAGITRQDDKGLPEGGWHPDQKMTLEETLRGYTAGSAFAAFDENRLGILRPGMRADLVVLDRDLFKVQPLDLLKAVATETIVDGEVVFQRR
jgi:predicted amidohydrolase YtcJ